MAVGLSESAYYYFSNKALFIKLMVHEKTTQLIGQNVYNNIDQSSSPLGASVYLIKYAHSIKTALKSWSVDKRAYNEIGKLCGLIH